MNWKSIIAGLLAGLSLLAGWPPVCAAGAQADNNIALNRAAYASSSGNYDNTAHLATDGSAETVWESKPGDGQWIAVDLGEPCQIHGVRLLWGASFAAAYQLQVSLEMHLPQDWTAVYSTTTGAGGNVAVSFRETSARWVRLYIPQCPNGCALREFQILGVRPAQMPPRPDPTLLPDGRLPLTGGAWRVQNATFVKEQPDQLSRGRYDDRNWIPAMVPGTVLSSYLDAGAIPDPRYADQQFQVSDWFFTRNDFWYRDSFTVPRSFGGRRTWLHFDGINWKADVYLNGAFIGHIDGGYTRSRFDVTSRVRPGSRSTLAVLIHQVAHPGGMNLKSLTHIDHNGGVLGLDSPTFVSSIGWNWLPTIRGRNTGIWNDVYLDSTGDLTLDDPFVTTDLALPDVSHTDLEVRVNVRNHSPRPQTGILRGQIGNITFQEPLVLSPLETRELSLDKTKIPELVLQNPKLWWPNGYGEQPLYTLNLSFDTGGKISDRKDVTFGVRKLTYEVREGVLFLLVNGHRILIRGGNWGTDEGMLRCDREGYDIRVRLHHDMHLNMIRNWVGMTAGDGFYEACDRYGILIWDDFWLANPGDGPNPTDHVLFLVDARDRILRTRNHPSLALYCGRNEGDPPPDIDAGLRQAVEELDGTRQYIPNSAAGTVSGHGPYEVQDPEWYFAHRGKTLHSELGIVCVPPVESLRTYLPADKLWPINDLWGLHDLCPSRGPLYVKRVNSLYSNSEGAAEFCRKAQMVNLETAKAMTEAWQSKQGSGVLIWMTNPAWPSMICQLYDYDFEPTGAFFGAQKGSEPLHVFWDSSTNQVKVANNTLDDEKHLLVESSLYNLDGRRQSRQQTTLTVPSGTAAICFPLERPAGLSSVYFIKLILKRGDQIVSDNFYWTDGRTTGPHDYRALSTLPPARLSAALTDTVAGTSHTLNIRVNNPTANIALMVRLKIVRDRSGERVLPAYYQLKSCEKHYV